MIRGIYAPKIRSEGFDSMPKKYFKMVIAILLIIEFSFIVLTIKSFSNQNINKNTESYNVDKKKFAMYVENEVGEYDEYLSSDIFQKDYVFNLSKSNCVDSNGNNIANVLMFSNGKLTVISSKTVFCYLYFDFPKITVGTIGYSIYNTDNTNINYEGEIPSYICTLTAFENHFNDKITILSFDSPLIIINLNDIGDTILTIFACDRTERLDLNILIQ